MTQANGSHSESSTIMKTWKKRTKKCKKDGLIPSYELCWKKKKKKGKNFVDVPWIHKRSNQRIVSEKSWYKTVVQTCLTPKWTVKNVPRKFELPSVNWLHLSLKVFFFRRFGRSKFLAKFSTSYIFWCQPHEISLFFFFSFFEFFGCRKTDFPTA